MNSVKQSACWITAIWITSGIGVFASSFDDANKLYEKGGYQDAIQAYQAVLSNQPTAAVYFNLGNAYFKSGQLGDAIAEYRQAAAYAPRDPDIQANLKFARARVSGPSYLGDWKERIAGNVTNRQWILLSCAGTWTFFLLLAVRQLRPMWTRSLMPWTAVSAVLGLGLTVSCLWVTHDRNTTEIAVVVQRDAVMRLGPFDESKSMMTLQDGTELKVIDHKNDWLQVTADDKSVGWINQSAARIVS